MVGLLRATYWCRRRESVIWDVACIEKNKLSNSKTTKPWIGQEVKNGVRMTLVKNPKVQNEYVLILFTKIDKKIMLDGDLHADPENSRFLPLVHFCFTTIWDRPSRA